MVMDYMLNAQNKLDPVQLRIQENAKLFGNKAANLIELDSLSKAIKSKKIHVQIPEIFPVSDEIIKNHLDQYASGWREKWNLFIELQSKYDSIQNKLRNKRTEIASLSDDAKNVLKELQTIVVDCFKQYPIDEKIIDTVKLPPGTLLMVRSTGEEDNVDIANPGGNESVAAVKLDRKSISDAIAIVVASYFSEKSLTQRLLSKDSIIKTPFVPVLMQKMIGEELNGENDNKIVVSGVMYANGAITRIDAAPGHGELIVNSKAPFDTYNVTQQGLVHAEINHKNSRLVPVEVIDLDGDENPTLKRKLVFKENPAVLKGNPSLSPDVALAIARIGRIIAKHYDMPMDIEFVYQPDNQTLYLVQARPIPQNHHNIKPSAITSAYWATFKVDNSVDKIKCKVISPAGNAAKIITSSEQMIFAKTISQALKSYLENASIQDKIKAVIIKNDAPATSHEAAQFNALGIPVLQTKLKPVANWLNADKPVMIIDTQHQHIINWSKYIGDHDNAENEIAESGIIEEGLFSSSLSTRKTLLPMDYKVKKSIEETVKKYLDEKKENVSAKDFYKQLLQCFDDLEAAQQNSGNEAAYKALHTATSLFAMLGTSTRAKEANTPHKLLFQHAMYSIAEIDHCLNELSCLPADASTLIVNNKQQELLDLVSKLKALVVNQGEENLYSDSIMQIAAQFKSLSEIKMSEENLTADQREFYQEFLKLHTLTYSEDVKTKWNQFALACSKKPFTRQLLAKTIMLSSQYKFESELINDIFVDCWNSNCYQAVKSGGNDSPKFDSILADVFTEVSKYVNEISQYHLKENHSIIASWENRIKEWSNPDNFENLSDNYTQEFIPLIERISINNNMSSITKLAILKQVQYLADVMDRTIKSVKGSSEYTKDQTDLVISRFIQLLVQYYDLMAKWMKAIPDNLYNKWALKIDIGEDSYNSKNPMLNCIARTFNNISNGKCNASQLQSSGYLSVASVKVGTTASFKRQFYEQRSKLTLEDLFSLMHQNILASTVILGSDTKISMNQLPSELHPLFLKLKSDNKTEFLGITHQNSEITMEYNIPLNNHSAKMILNYDKQNKHLDLQLKFFGRNWNGRMDEIARIASIEGLLLDAKVISEPLYSEECRSLEFSWRFKLNQADNLTKFINAIIRHYAEMTEGSKNSIMSMLDRHFNASTSDEDIIQQLSPNSVNKLKEIFSAFDAKFLNRVVDKYPAVFKLLSDEYFATLTIQFVYDNLDKYDFDKLEVIIDKSPIKIDSEGMSYNGKYNVNNSEVFYDKVFDTFTREDSIKFIEKYQPDLTKLSNVVADELKSHTPDLIFIRLLIANGAPFKNTKVNIELIQSAFKDYSASQMKQWIDTNSKKIHERSNINELQKIYKSKCKTNTTKLNTEESWSQLLTNSIFGSRSAKITQAENVSAVTQHSSTRHLANGQN